MSKHPQKLLGALLKRLSCLIVESYPKLVMNCNVLVHVRVNLIQFGKYSAYGMAARGAASTDVLITSLCHEAGRSRSKESFPHVNHVVALFFCFKHQDFCSLICKIIMKILTYWNHKQAADYSMFHEAFFFFFL